MPSVDQKKTTLKRKSRAHNPGARKKAKVQVSSADALPWKKLQRPVEAGVDGDDGILELEEVEGVEVIYEETEGGRVVKFNVLEETGQKPDEVKESDDERGAIPVGEASQEDTKVVSFEPFNSQNLLPDWHSFNLHPNLLRALHEKTFFSPTPIQSRAIPIALAGRDVVGVAETGSGKTLAYGLPILHSLLSNARPPTSKSKRQLKALILAPTRELALQISSHLNACLSPPKEIPVKELEERIGTRGKEKSLDSGKSKLPPLVSVAAIVGGMSVQKQRRILDRGIDILVATPGRLWDIMEEDDDLAAQIKKIKFFVLDEADRMIEAGHFAELDNILRLTLRESEEDLIEPELNSVPDEKAQGGDSVNVAKDGLQTFVFSATLSKDLQRNLKKRTRLGGSRKKKIKPASTLDDLLLRLDFRDPEPQVIDISPEGGVVSSLKESKIECLSADKDVYLYYFLLRYPGRSLVFLSSIDGIRRLMPLMELLNVKAFPLYSQLEQRQRLKNLDRFKSTPNSVLLATDIAARGLDIPSVDHVIHYQIPRTADAYVHRNGRTARAQRKGFSMLMCGPDERKLVRSLLGSLNREDTEIPEMSVELTLLDKLKARIQLARKIDTAQHIVKKQNHEKNWLKETAEAMEIEIDSDFAGEFEEEGVSKHKAKAKSAKTAALKAELKELLSQPLVARGVSMKYITSGSRSIVDDLLSGNSNEMLLGLQKTEAGNDLVIPKKKMKPTKQEPLSYEEWNGFGS